MAMIGDETLASAIAIAVITALAILVSNFYLRSRSRLGPPAASGGGRRCSELADKPQNQFKRVRADNSYSHFKHFKPEGKEREISLKVHPFVEEITSLLDNPPSFTTLIASQGCPQMSSTYTWIDTEAQLESLAKQLSSEKIFAVDTEQHSLRSYLGFTALMQISTHNEDYLIDTIALHDKMGLLRPVFADPSICKIITLSLSECSSIRSRMLTRFSHCH